MVVTLSGSNDYLIKLKLDDYKKAYSDYEVIEVSNLDVRNIKINLLNMSIFGGERCVVLDHPSENKEFKDEIENIVTNLPDETLLVIVETDFDKRSNYFKVLHKNSQFNEYKSLEINELSRWLVSYVKDQGGSISNSVAIFLLNQVGDNQILLKNELNKLLLYDLNITKENIELLVEPNPSSTIFELIDASITSNLSKAFKLYGHQRAQKIEPENILAMFIWQLHIIALIKTYKGNPSELYREVNIKPFVIQKSLNISRNISLLKIKDLIAFLKKADTYSKTKNVSLDEYLKNFLVKLAYN